MTTVKQTKRNSRVAWMSKTSLAFHQQDVVMLMRENLFLDGAADKVRHDTIDWATVALDDDAGLTSSNELRAVLRIAQSRR